MNNSAVLEHADAQIRDVEAHLSHLDSLIGSETSAKLNVDRLKDDIFELHKNSANLEQKVRASRLTNAVSLLALEESDLKTLQAESSNTKKKIATADQLAKESLKEISWLLMQARKAKVEAHLAEIINFATLLLRPEDISRCAQSVLEVEAALNMLSGFVMQNDFDGAVAMARQTREFGAPILAWASEELDESPSIDVQPSPMAELATV